MDRDSSPKRNGCACRAGSLYYTDWLYLCQKSWIFRFFPQILLPVSSAGEKPFPSAGGASTAAVRSPSKRAKTQTPGRPGGKGTALALSFQRPLSAIIRRENSPFCNNIFSFSQTIAIKTSLSPPSAGKTSGRPKKKSQSHCRDWLFPHGTPDAIRTHGLPLRRTNNSLSYDSLTLHSASFCVNLAQ